MFNLFQKKFKSLSEYPENWSIIPEKKPVPAIIRINMGYKDAVGHPEYPIKMGIAIPVKNHDEDIMVLKIEIENMLENILLKKGNGALVFIFTALEDPKYIEFLSYTKRSGVDFPKIHQDIQNKFTDYEVQMFAANDPKWEAYKSFGYL